MDRRDKRDLSALSHFLDVDGFLVHFFLTFDAKAQTLVLLVLFQNELVVLNHDLLRVVPEGFYRGVRENTVVRGFSRRVSA